MKTPSRTFIIIVLALIAIVSVVIFQACATGSDGAGGGNTFFVKIGKDENTFVEFVQPGGKEKFDRVLRRLPSEQYSIRYKKDDSGPRLTQIITPQGSLLRPIKLQHPS